MAKNKTNNSGLIASIIFGSMLLSGSMVFFAMQMNGGSLSQDDLAKEIQAGISAYVENAQKGAQEAENVPTVDINQDLSDDDPVMGIADAPITVVEFSNFQCSWCGYWHENVLPKLKATYIDTGKVKLVYRDFTPSGFPAAYPGALAANCAREQGGDGVYYKMHDEIFKNQASLGQGEKATFVTFAKTVGLDEAAFVACFDADKYQEEIQNDMAVGRGLGIDGTPGFVVGNVLVKGAEDFEKFQQLIDQQLSAQ